MNILSKSEEYYSPSTKVSINQPIFEAGPSSVALS
jgi:hypothetical protein